ncbi:MAG: ATP-binding protein [Catenulispora sp.]
MSTTTEATEATEATPPPSGVVRPGGPDPAAPKDPYLRRTDETVLLDLRELRAQQAAAAAAPESIAAPRAELERYQGSHRAEAMLYAHGGTAIPLERVREVCHDLRQPVAAILMLASAAEMRPDVPERVRAVLQEIMTQTEDISATVRQFLDDAKQGVDGLGDPVPCNVAGLAAESVERWRATFSGRISLAADDPLHVTVDPVLFKRALGNILSNGTRAAGGNGRVQVTIRRFHTAQGQRAVIEVDDSGPGFGNIPAGHGLGLAVVRRTIEAAGGWVEVAEGPLGGALIRMVLPVTPIRPLSADDELAKTVHGEISLSALAEELAGMHAAAVDFDDIEFETGFGEGFEGFDEFEELDEFEDFEDFEEFEGTAFDDTAFDSTAFDSTAPVTGGHAFSTRISALPEPMAISGAPERMAISGAPAAPGDGSFDTFRTPHRSPGTPEQAAIGGMSASVGLPGAPTIPAPASGTDRRYSGPPVHTTGETDAGRGFFDVFQAPDRTATARRSPSPETDYATPLWARGAAPAPETASDSESDFASDFASRASATLPLPAAPAPTPEPEEFRITATGQDDTAVAAIQLPSQTPLTHPPRIPASALRPVASVQLSLLPGGAF